MSTNLGLRVLISICALAGTAAAQCSTWSEGFVPAGMDGPVRALAVYDDGAGPMLYACGTFERANGERAPGVARLEGSHWKALVPEIDGECLALRVYDDGTGPALFVGGNNLRGNGVLTGGLLRWDGQSAVPPGGGVDGRVWSLEVFDGGGVHALYVGGEFVNAGGVFDPGIARWDGSHWTSLGWVLHGYSAGIVRCMQVGDDGSGPALYVGGNFTWAGGLATNSIARFDGKFWSSLGIGIPTGQYESVNALTSWMSPNGPQLVAGGAFCSADGVSAHRIAAWNGTSWSELGGGAATTCVTREVDALAVHDFGSGERVCVGGDLTMVGTVAVVNMATWDGSTWSSVEAGGAPGGVLVLESLDLGNGPVLFVGGNFTRAGSALAGRIASFDGTRFHAVGAANALAYDDQVRAMATFDDGSGTALYVGGMAQGAADSYQDRGGMRFDGTSWTALPSGIRVAAFATFDDGAGTKLYVAGSSGGSIARWNGSSFEPLPGAPSPVTSGTCLASFDDGTGPALYVGNATTGGGSLWRWKDHVWSAISPSPSGDVDRLVVFDDGTGPALFVGGQFTHVGSVSAAYVAKWDGTSWSSLGLTLFPPASGTVVRAFAVHDDGSGPALYVGGNFSGVAGTPSTGIARWNGSAWSAVAQGTTGPVNAISSWDDGSGHGVALYAAGGFTSASGAAASGIARWDGATWQGVGEGLTIPMFSNARGQALAVFDDGTRRDLWVGGFFQQAGGHVSEGIARVEGCGQTGELFCFGDGSGVACPCGNESAAGDRAGCRNSLGSGGEVRARGRSTLSGDTLVLAGGAMPDTAALYFQGALRTSGAVFGDGLTCTGGPFVRLGTKVNTAGASQLPGPGEPSVSVKGHVVAPGTRHYQVRYRNAAAFCTPATFNYTNAVTIVWAP